MCVCVWGGNKGFNWDCMNYSDSVSFEISSAVADTGILEEEGGGAGSPKRQVRGNFQTNKKERSINLRGGLNPLTPWVPLY